VRAPSSTLDSRRRSYFRGESNGGSCRRHLRERSGRCRRCIRIIEQIHFYHREINNDAHI